VHSVLLGLLIWAVLASGLAVPRHDQPEIDWFAGGCALATIQTVASRDVESKVLHAPGAVALDFYQATCAPCRVLEPRLMRVAEQYRGRIPIYRVDIDRDLPVAQRFRVMSIPTVLILKAGKEVERLDGLITEDQLQSAFHRVAGPTSEET
jgi:thioredoxin